MEQNFEDERRKALVEHLVEHAGSISAIELRGLGIDKSATRTLVRRGELERLRPGLFRSALVPRSPLGAARAAFLGCPSAIAVIYATSAYLQGFLSDPPPRPQLGGARKSVGTMRRRKGFDFHPMANTSPDDLLDLEGIVVTTPLRTCLDLSRRATTEGRRRLAATVLRAATRSDAKIPELLEARIKKERRVPGNQITRDLLAELPGTLLVRSPLEVDFIYFCVAHGLPLPQMNQVVHGIECDAAWIWAMLAVELDSKAYHEGEEPFERDRARDAVLMVKGWRVLRVTKARLLREPEVVAEQIRALLAMPPTLS